MGSYFAIIRRFLRIPEPGSRDHALHCFSWLMLGKGREKSILETATVDSKKFEHGCRMICAGFPSVFGLGLEDGPVPTFCFNCCRDPCSQAMLRTKGFKLCRLPS